MPTVEECEKIVARVRNQEFADTADRTADVLALAYAHGCNLGQAGEAYRAGLERCRALDGKKEVIIWERKKTGQYFEVPFYSHLEPVLLDIWELQGKPKEGKVVSIPHTSYRAQKRVP